jgi:hypothetical protein
MGYNANLRKEIGKNDSWGAILKLTETEMSYNSPSMKHLQTETLNLSASLLKQAKMLTTELKTLNTHLGEFESDFKAWNEAPDEMTTIQDFVFGHERSDKLPSGFLEEMKSFSTFKLSVSNKGLADQIAKYRSWLSKDIATLQEKCANLSEDFKFLSEHWTHVTTGEVDSEESEGKYEAYRIMLEIFLSELKQKLNQKRNETENENVPEELREVHRRYEQQQAEAEEEFIRQRKKEEKQQKETFQRQTEAQERAYEDLEAELKAAKEETAKATASARDAKRGKPPKEEKKDTEVPDRKESPETGGKEESKKQENFEGKKSYGVDSHEEDEGYGAKPRPEDDAKKAPKRNEHPKQWGDYSSSDEDENISSVLNSFGESSEKGGIEVPKDFDEQFPSIDRAWRKLCAHWNWPYKRTGQTMAQSGFIANHYGFVDEDERSELLSKLNDDQKLNLKTFVNFLASPLYKPESLHDSHSNIVATWVASLMLKYKYKDDEDKSLLRIALKGSDGGENLVRSRCYACFTTGSQGLMMLWNSVTKMINKQIQVSKSVEIEETLKESSEMCYTTVDGMLSNTYNIVSKEQWVKEETTTGRGQKKEKRVKKMRLGKDKPSLNSANLILKPTERVKLSVKLENFNNIEKFARNVCEKHADVKDPLSRPRLIKKVVFLAYAKISEIRRTNKERRNLIRAKAQGLAGEKTISQSQWTTAESELMSGFPEIDSTIFDHLKWSMDEIVE